MSVPVLQEIKVALIDLTEGMKEPDTHKMLASMERLDALLVQGRSEIHPRLAHFLERRSYAKALDFLSGVADIPSGNCGSRRDS